MFKGRNNVKIDFRRNLKTYYGVTKPYRFLFVLATIAVLILAIIRIGEKYLIKILVDEGNLFVSGEMIKSEFVNLLILITLAYALAYVLKSLFQWSKVHLINRIDAGMIADMKKKFFSHVVGLSHKFHTSHKTGSLISSLIRGSNSVEGMNDFVIFNGVPLIFQLVAVGASILYFDFLSALVLVLVSLAFIVFSINLLSKQQSLRFEANKIEDLEKGNVSDVFTNIDSVKYFGKEGKVIQIFNKMVKRTQEKFLRTWDMHRFLDAGQSLIMGLGLFFVMYFPTMRFLEGEITIGTLVFIYTVYFNLAEPLYSFVYGIRGFYKSMADFEALFRYADINNEIEDQIGAKDLNIVKGAIKFDNVVFNYHKRKALDGINLDIKPGEKVALVGHSGSGKTTMMKLLFRLYDVNGGKILIDGENIKDVKQTSLRGSLSIVPQEAILFDDTIYNNILFSNPEASRKDVLRAIKFAQLDRLINDMPKGEKTIVGERGVKLSGGEKQRVSIARALLADKKILVLDEATSALDSQTEHEIQKDLERLMEGRTSIIIAHRLSTVMRADKIVVLDKGKVVQMGRHRDLINKKGRYKELWDLQKGGFLDE